MPTWTEDALDLWNDLYAEFGEEMVYQSTTIHCIRNPIKSGFQMQPAGYNLQADTILDILRTDAVTSGLYAFKQANPQEKRPVVRANDVSFQVISMENDDPVQPSVRFMCQKVLAVSAG